MCTTKRIRENLKFITIVAMLMVVSVILSVRYVFADDSVMVSYESNGTNIIPFIKDDVQYLYLPNDKSIDIKDLEVRAVKPIAKFDRGVFSETVNAEGVYIYRGDFSQFKNENSPCQITFDDGSHVKLVVIKSNIPSVSVELNNTTLSDINSGSKNIKYPGNTVFVTDENGNISANGMDNVEIKGRGNSTWRLDKKPYQIKFTSKTSVLGMKKAKKWVLLANYLDGSLLRNKTSYDLAINSGLKGGVSSKFTDLWIDGEYQGNYLISQKVDSGSGNLALSDNGILAELDNIHYEEENNWFFSKKSNSHFTLKECNSTEDMTAVFDSFENKMDTVERLIYAEKKDWDKISAMINEESFAKMYLLYEYTENEDAMKSSTYFYCDGGEIYMGPAWDFDRSLGNCDDNDVNVAWLKSKVKDDALTSTYFNELITIPQFRELVKKEYRENFQQALDKAIANVDTNADFVRTSANMNQIIWKTFGCKIISSMKPIATSYQKNVDELSEWMIKRKAYMDKEYGTTYISGELPDDGYYTFNSCADKNITLAINDDGCEYADDTSNGQISKIHQFSVMNLSDNKYDVQSLYTGKTAKKFFTDAGNGYYYIQDKDGRYLTYENGEITYRIADETQLGTAQKWVLYRTAVRNVKDGVYTLSPKSNESLNISVENGSIDKNARICLSSANNKTEQLFYVKYCGDGYYTIKSEKSGYVMDIVNGSSESGAHIQQYADNKSDGQLWSFVKNSNGTYTIISKKGTVISTKFKNPINGTTVAAMADDDSDNQKWIMEAPKKSIDDGTYKIVNYKNTDRIIGITNASARITDRKKDNTSFEIKWDKNNQAYTIMQGNKALTFNQGSKVALKDYKKELTQLWYIEAEGNGSYMIRCKAGGLVGSSSETMKIGAYIQMTESKASEGIRWKLINAEDPDYEAIISNARTTLFSKDFSASEGSHIDHRFSGRDRFKTALDIADGLKTGLNKAKFESIIVASGDNYPDALAGSSLVRSKDYAPIILVSKTTEQEILAYIQSNLAANGRIYLLGGKGVISENFEKSLKNSLKNKEVNITRLSGVSRYDTNLDILRTSGLEGEELIISDGYGYADSLSISATGKPIMLVGKSLSSNQQDFIEKELKPSKITIIGGNSVVSDRVENTLKAYARKNDIELHRIYGDTRYETSTKIAEEYFNQNDCSGTMTLAYGGNFPDGLAGSSMSMALKSPLILVDKGSADITKKYVIRNSIDKIAVLGGTGVIADSLIQDIMDK